jgi:hypothetical protein
MRPQAEDLVLPLARSKGLLVQGVADELVVYDLERHRMHRLNQTAALVWRHCDGNTSVAQLARLVHEKFGVPKSEELVWYVLHRLAKTCLLQGEWKAPGVPSPITRRQLVHSLGRGLAILIPVVYTLIAPTPAMAASFQP